MSQDLAVYAICTAGITGCCIGIAYAVAHRQAQARLEAAQTAIRILQHWGAHWHSVATALTAEKDAERRKRSFAGSHARACRTDQERARIAATTAALREAA